MATINFNQIGSFNGVAGEGKILTNPTSIQFGADGRLYVAEQNGSINAFTVELQNGEYVATEHEELLLPNGGGVVKSIQNYNDDGSLGIDNGNPVTNRQVTGLVVTGTAANPVLYVSSSDPRIAFNGEKQLDTNSGVVTQLTWTGTEWVAVDIIRGLPRSEENHSVNGMVLSPDGTKLYLTVGGNTNNGAPSQFFSYTGEYALSGTVLEIDLADIASRPVLTDAAGGQNGAARQYIYDLPTLDDPTVPNDGVREDINGLDVAGPWGGNDGLNMAILPADAPLRIFADGFRNQYDLVFTENGQLFTVDNGSNGNLGGNPLDSNGNPTEQPGAGEATNAPNGGGTGDPEPLFLIEDGNYYGHPAPARANQTLPWTVLNDNGNPDTSVSPNTVASLADLVPDGVDIQNGFIIDPSRFTGNAARLSESGIRVPRNSPESNSIFNLGSSSNGLVEYTADAFDGALQGALIVTQFNGNITLLNINEDGTALEPLIDPGNDGILGTTDDEVIDSNGEFPLVTGQSQPLDVTVGPDGTIWVAEFGPDNINVFVPSDVVLPDDPDFDNDGILNIDDPFIRDGSNGGSVLLFPGQTLLWDFDANQDDNLPGPNGYGGGLTGVLIDGVTDFEQFFQEPATLPNQIINLDNVKFTTAAGGGTTVIESVSNGSPLGNSNNGEYLFHTGVTTTEFVETFTVTWTVFNPANFLTGASQQIGGYIGTGDQSNYLKIVATQSPQGEIQLLLEEDDVVQSSSFIQADGLFQVPDNQKIFFELEIDPSAATATPTVTYELGNGSTNTVSGSAIDLSGTAVLDAILGNYTVQGQASGLAVGLLASNTGQDPADTFQAIFDDIEITATGDTSSTVLYRVNAGGNEIAAVDGGIPWSADTIDNNSPFLVSAGSNNTAMFSEVEPGATVPFSTPGAIFDSERWDSNADPEMQWAFDVPVDGLYEVRLYLGNGFGGTSAPGERVFDVALEGQPITNFPNLDNIDLSQQFGHQVGGLISNTVIVTDGTINIDFINGVENPLINGIEIIQIGGGTTPVPTVELTDSSFTVSESSSQVEVSLTSSIAIPAGEAVEITLEIVPETATALVDYEYLSPTASFNNQTGVYTDTITIEENLSDASLVIDILPDSLVEGDEAFAINVIGVSSNANLGSSSATVTIVDDDTNSNPTSDVLYRVNAGGPEITSLDGDIPWSADTTGNNSPFLVESGSNTTASFIVEPGSTVPNETPAAIFNTERWDSSAAPEMEWAFDVPESGLYEVRLYVGNGFSGTNDPGERVFDVAIEGSVPNNLNDVDLSNQFGNLVGGLISNTVNVTDGTLNIEFLHVVENPLINGIEIIQVNDSTPVTPTVFIVNAAETVNEDSSQVQISLTTDITVPNGEPVDVTFEIIPGSATPELDYEFPSGTFNSATGIYTGTVSIAENSSDVTILVDILQDTIAESDEAFTVQITDVSSNANLGTDTATVTITDDDVTGTSGEAVLGITVNSNNVQISNFGDNSFQVTNTGDKKIAQIEIDVTNALYPDAVFDPFGQAGDTVSKPLTINTNGDTGVVAPSNASYIGVGGSAGYKGIQLVFNDNVNGGFEPGETIGFSIDMDANSVAGTEKLPLDGGSNPGWDVGGVSGAELIGSSFTVTFIDGTTATGQLQGVGNQGGAQAIASQDTPNLDVTLTVNGLDAGGVGTYGDSDPSIIVNGPAGETARIVLTKGFIQPVTPYAQFLEDQLDELALADFPANNAVEFQTVDVVLTGGNQDISEQFNFSDVANFNFEGEDRLPLGFVASVIEPANNDLPLGSVSQPVYLEFAIDDPVGATVIYRVNAGGSEIAALDSGPDWSADTANNNSPFLVEAGSNNTAGFPAVSPGAGIPNSVPDSIFNNERWDNPAAPEMQWAFDVPASGLYEVRLYMGNGFEGTSNPGERVFDVAIEGSVPNNLNDVDLSNQFGHLVGGVITNTVAVNDGTLDIEFIHGVENPLINGIEILQLNA